MLPTLMAGQAAAATLTVGPGQTYALPSQAAAAARDGDMVLIAAGSYRDCAVWTASRLSIVGAGAGKTHIGGLTCQQKGVFVISGAQVTVSDLWLSGARSVDGNGAGIRAEGASLTVQRVQVTDNQDGILTDNLAGASLLVEDSRFAGNGACLSGDGCAHGIYAGHIGQLTVLRSVFTTTRQGHHIKSRAAATLVQDCTITDSADGTASYEIDAPNGGAVTITGNLLTKGAKAENTTAIAIGEEGVTWPTPALAIDANRYNSVHASVFVSNRTTTAAALSGNTLGPGVTALVGPGSVR